MAELTGDDVEEFTNGRLDGSSDQVAGMLDAALKAARDFTGWHVSPVQTDTFTLDGPDSRMLTLPTRKLVTLTDISENGVSLDLSKLMWSAGGPPAISQRPVTVRKRNNGWWSADYQSITVTLTHGYTEAEAPDWRRAVLTMVDQMSLVPVSGGMGFSTSGMTQKRVDDVQYRWDPGFSLVSEDVLFSVDNVLDNYVLPRVEYF